MDCWEGMCAAVGSARMPSTIEGMMTLATAWRRQFRMSHRSAHRSRRRAHGGPPVGRRMRPVAGSGSEDKPQEGRAVQHSR